MRHNNNSASQGWGATAGEKTLGKAPCQNCGREVTVLLPFLGCVFCGDCMKAGDTGQYDGTEDFYDKRR